MPIGDIIAGIGGVGSLLGGLSAGKASKEMMRRQAQAASLANQSYLAAQPYYRQALEQAARYAGIGAPAPGPGLGGGVGYGTTGGGFGTPEDQLRLRQAEEDAERYYRQQAEQLRHQLGGAGAGGALQAGLARLGGEQAAGLAGFRRQLAINAPQEQARRLAVLQSLIGQGFGQGAQAANIYGQQGAQYGQQAGQGFGQLGNILSNWQYMRALQGLGGQQPNIGLQNDLLRAIAQENPEAAHVLADRWGYGYRPALGGAGGTADTYGLQFGQRF